MPKATGREAMIEKRKERGAPAREGAAAKADTTIEFTDSELMGSGGTDDFKAMVAREKARKAQREDAKANRAAEYQEKEKEKMRALVASLGLSDKYQI